MAFLHPIDDLHRRHAVLPAWIAIQKIMPKIGRAFDLIFDLFTYRQISSITLPPILCPTTPKMLLKKENV